MQPSREAPRALNYVAALFIIGGICACIEVVCALFQGRISINFGVLGLFIGPGLLRFSQGWRTCGLVFIWIALIGVPIVGLLMLAGSRSVNFHVLGVKLGVVPLPVGLLVAAVVFGIALWEYRVLTRPDVRRLFGLPQF